MRDTTGNIPPLPGVFPRHDGTGGRTSRDGARQLMMMPLFYTELIGLVLLSAWLVAFEAESIWSAAVLLGSLSKAFGDDVIIAGGDAGLHVVLWLKRVAGENEDVLIARATADGIGLYPPSGLYYPAAVDSHPGMVGLVLGYAVPSEQEIRQGVRRLAGVLKALRA
jgi:hypothetical protein